MILTNYLPLFTALVATASAEQSHLRKRELNQKELQDDSRLYVQYTSKRGRHVAQKCARKIIQDFDDDNVMIIQGNGQCLDELSKDADIKMVEFDEKISAIEFEYPQAAASQAQGHQGSRDLAEIYPWGLSMIQADLVSTGDNDITVCIVDSGIAVGHPDFSEDRISGDDMIKWWVTWPWDRDVRGHGTHVAGTIAALAGNDAGVAGAGNFKLHIVRALDDEGNGYESDIRAAVQQCERAGAQIINLSLGGPGESRTTREYLTFLVEEKGIMLIAAAGDSVARPIFPASYSSVISVGAVYEWESRWRQSNRNDQIELMAPGHNILSTTTALQSVQLSDFAYTAFHIPGTANEEVTGTLVRCDADDKKCKDAKGGGICIFAKDGTDVTKMVESCQKGGGAGAIIFSADGSNRASWSVPAGEDIRIPAYAVSPSAGSAIHARHDEEATIGAVGEDGRAYTYEVKNGTSMASPHVAASAALLWSNFGDCTNHQIRYAMTRNAYHPEGGVCDENYGYGIVKTHDAYEWLSANPCSQWDVQQISEGGCTTV